MGFLKRLIGGRAVLGAMVAGGLLVAPGIAGAWTFDQTLGIWREQASSVASPSDVEAKPRQQLAQAKVKTPLPTPIVERAPTNVEIVNRAINPGASDPNVPLPRADLSDASGNPASQTSGAPRIYGRQEDGGAVLGLRVPIPAERNASGATARYGVGRASPEPGSEARER